MTATSFLGLNFDPLDFPATLARLAARPADAPFGYVVTPNVDHIVRLEHAPPDVRSAYDAAELCLCDSRILAKLARLRGVRLDVVPGSDLTAALFEQVIRPGDRICVIGSGPEQIAVLAKRFPGLDIRNHVPPMGFRHNPAAMAAAAAFVAEAGARFTLLAVGSPQQELLAHRIRQDGRATGIGLCIGASIDFLTGAQQRAPVWVQKASLEWAHRLLSQPQRMWRRYLVEGPRIFRLVMRWQANSSSPAQGGGSPQG